MIAFERTELDRFKAIVGERLGLHFADGQEHAVVDALRERIGQTGSPSATAYLARLTQPGTARAELRAVAERLTVPETYFFRDASQLRAFSEVVLPDRLAARRSTGHLRILSAGCASGEEPYTLAMAVRDHLGETTPWRVSILGIDLNVAMLEKARAARYSPWSFRQTPEAVRERSFRADGKGFVLDPAIRAMVTLEERNLIEDDPLFWRPDSFDVVFCRNVLMYFSAELIRQVVARIAHALAPGGYFFLGHAETLRGVSQEFHLRSSHDTFYYQRRAPDDRAEPSPFAVALARPSLEATPPPLDGDWVAAIASSSQRISSLPVASERARTRPTAPPAAAIPPPSVDLGAVLALIQRERFTEALALLDALPPPAQRRHDVQLLRAVLLTNRGDLASAELVCGEVLRSDELNAGAHYLMALCREQAGDHGGALAHDRTAIYLESGFAMPHLHLGLVAKKAGDLDTARRELSEALILLSCEEPSRVAMFGGGFSRDALVELCRTELRGCGGRP